MENKKNIYQIISGTAAKSLRQIADELEAAESPLCIATAISQCGAVVSNLFGVAAQWDNQERKRAA